MEAWIKKVIVLSAGGAFGVNARYWLGVWMNRWASPQFPWATFTINVTGSFAIGIFTIGLTRWLPHPNLRLLLITGFLGGYTTFSTLQYDSGALWERGELLVAANMVGSVMVGFVAVLLGIAIARGLGPAHISVASRGDLSRQFVSPSSSQVSINGPASMGNGVDLSAEKNGKTP